MKHEWTDQELRLVADAMGESGKREIGRCVKAHNKDCARGGGVGQFHFCPCLKSVVAVCTACAAPLAVWSVAGDQRCEHLTDLVARGIGELAIDVNLDRGRRWADSMQKRLDQHNAVCPKGGGDVEPRINDCPCGGVSKGGTTAVQCTACHGVLLALSSGPHCEHFAAIEAGVVGEIK